MPASKITLKDKKLEVTLTGVAFTVGNDQVTIESLTAAIDVQDLLHSVVPEHILPPIIPVTGPDPGAGVRLIDFGMKKIQVIKEMRAATGLGLKESKELVEKAPCFIQAGQFNCSTIEVVRELGAAGAHCEVVDSDMEPVPPPPQPKVLHLLQKLLADAAGMTKVSDEKDRLPLG